MTPAELRRLLIEIPDVEVPAQLEGIEESIEYLGSDEAVASLAEDPYWPKWASPWWQMVLLFELGEARRIPERAVRAMVAALDALPMHTFPLRPEDWPAGLHPARHGSCHCALGSIDQVLTACGVDVDAELPWIRAWFVRYQMADGGLNCDETAYLVADECPSSMVGTIAPFEAMLRRGPSDFVERAAGLLVARELVRGSDTRHNAEEREAAKVWTAPTFPRFYFYDVLRGATALVRWATELGRSVPLHAIAPAVTHLATIAGDGVVRVGRQAYARAGTWTRDAGGAWGRVPAADRFPLLEAVSRVDAPSARLTAEWRATRRALVELIDAGRVTA
ncbi:MAG TPA: hypothetical protein VM734_00325 [Kofleriaceae bacterium]|nr:hypothetical protein [Kofleriaceae bacterium]